jgi:hypothetical protein
VTLQCSKCSAGCECSEVISCSELVPRHSCCGHSFFTPTSTFFPLICPHRLPYCFWCLRSVRLYPHILVPTKYEVGQ